MLIVFGGLPGTGKTTLARQVSERFAATYLRIDAIEQAFRSAAAFSTEVGPAGYLIAYAVCEENLRLGRVVVADCVNPLLVTRTAWRDVARKAAVPMVEVEVICSDKGEHRRRIETRSADISGLALPTWSDVMSRHYEPWSEPRIVIDTALTNPIDAVDFLVTTIERRSC